MKPNTNMQKKKHRPPQPGQPDMHGRQGRGPQIRKAPQRTLRSVSIAAVCALVAFGGTWAFFELVIWNITPPELVGKWVVVDGEQEGATFDIFRSGALVGTVNIAGKEATIKARIRMEGKKLYWLTRSQSGQEDTRVKVIRTLTANAMVWEDEQGSVLNLKRAD